MNTTIGLPGTKKKLSPSTNINRVPFRGMDTTMGYEIPATNTVSCTVFTNEGHTDTADSRLQAEGKNGMSKEIMHEAGATSYK